MKTAHAFVHDQKDGHHFKSAKRPEIKMVRTATTKSFEDNIRQLMDAFELTNCVQATD